MSQGVFLDYRSDTHTRPTAEMRQAMATCEVGDDNYGEDPTINELENYASKLFGKEAALFLPTATMSNLTAVFTHCDERLCEYIVGDTQHIYLYEAGGASCIANVHARVLKNNPDGTLNLNEVEAAIREKDIHFPKTKMIAIENTHNKAGGRVIGLDYIEKLSNLAHRRNVKLHMDGARLFNAATVLKLPVAQLVKPVDSVTICLSKGLCGPTGALLIGEQSFILKARHARKVFGGGLRQGGVIAACGLVGLKTLTSRLVEDHQHARIIADGLSKLGNGQYFKIKGNAENVVTNMFYFDVKDSKAEEVVSLLQKDHGIKLDCYNTDMIRLVTHRDVPISNADYVVDAFKKVARTLFE